AKTTRRNQMRAQVVAGSFSGFSLRTMAPKAADMSVPLDQTAAPPVETLSRIHFQGAAIGASFFDTFSPAKVLAITTQFDRYGKNFLTARDDSQFNAQRSERVSMTLQPAPSVSLFGGSTRRVYLLGDPAAAHGFNYGATGTIPKLNRLQLSYIKS